MVLQFFYQTQIKALPTLNYMIEPKEPAKKLAIKDMQIWDIFHQ